ncbi:MULTISPECIES: DUF5329 family protein [Rhodanobacter]|uniref:DUF5329 family protein n=1 Tax=Rhodanobacter TaxID=75309 RepID=UPI00026106A3|nr:MULTISPECIES: DUF5329 family protein [Rhodanobacter]EIM04207.1 hypothetical protein UUC_03265 [Rhodanobacter denitrificans]KZC18987.1 hypothetical protein RHOFW104R3_33615 [Rhodanobacter denitrificans]UJJ52693.1 DUF5329 domain-containing protein [Rhodanobacter denitrificans]UJM88928.1 DUF5329 domain-containing protein [Rhodanobacter denitrificans]UJM95446.1 DUF5329 domain-containing protein [Rhodanobacter denitrificans]
MLPSIRQLPARLSKALLAWLLFALLLTPALARQPMSAPPTEQQKIDYLISTVATLHGASFIRNGSAYDAEQAAAHMRLKLRFAGSRVKTVDDFIVYCATGSSVSGTRYAIRFADGQSIDAATFLRGKLAVFRTP